MNAEILLTLKLDQQLFADPRRIELLKAIKQTGSLSQAAKLNSISYKTAWDAIHAMNQLAPALLVESSAGGKGGGGAKLTAYGSRLLQLYALLEQIQQKAFDSLQHQPFPLDSLLRAMARFSIQTSARNQLVAYVMKIVSNESKAKVYLQLNNSQRTIVANITPQSAQHLQLERGKEVLALIKASWLTISRDNNPHRENCFPAMITSIDRQTQYSELGVMVDDNLQFSATLSSESLDYQGLALNQQVYLSFDPESILIATLC